MFDSPARQLNLWSAESGNAEAVAEHWTVRQSPRARRLTVRVFNTGRVEVVVPRRTPQRAVERFLTQHREWIETRRRGLKRNAKPAEPFPPKQIDLAACGETWRLHFTGGARRPRIRVLAPGILGLEGNAIDARAAKQALQAWQVAKAAEVFFPLLAETARELGFKYNKAIVRRQRSRWGSCSARGTISLNCHLLFQSPEVVRYLFIHELAHTQHMNHSRRFWDCVARHCPDYKRLDRELRQGWKAVPAWAFGPRE